MLEPTIQYKHKDHPDSVFNGILMDKFRSPSGADLFMVRRIDPDNVEFDGMCDLINPSDLIKFF